LKLVVPGEESKKPDRRRESRGKATSNPSDGGMLIKPDRTRKKFWAKLRKTNWEVRVEPSLSEKEKLKS